MNTKDLVEMVSTRRDFLAVVATFLFAPTAFAQDDEDIFEIKRNREALINALNGIPYASEGSGPIIYVFSYSTCPYARAFETDWSGKLSNFEMRRIYYPVDNQSANETAALAMSRDVRDYRAFMFEGKRALDVQRSNEAIDAYNAVVERIKKIIEPTLQQNGFSRKGIISPHFFFSDGLRLFTMGGYTKLLFAKVLKKADLGRNQSSLFAPNNNRPVH
jgi:hypothetical protein